MTADECRRRCEECIVCAREAMDPQNKALWLKLATEWLQLARKFDLGEQLQ